MLIAFGIVYWMDAILCIKNNPHAWQMGDIYEYVARTRNTSYSRVERAMRTAVTPAIKDIRKKYNYYGRFTNKTFLSLIKFKLI